MKLTALTGLVTAATVALPAVALTSVPPEAVNYLALFFAFTTFYSEGLAAIPAIKSNAIYQQVGAVLKTVASLLTKITR